MTQDERRVYLLKSLLSEKEEYEKLTSPKAFSDRNGFCALSLTFAPLRRYLRNSWMCRTPI